MQNYKMMVLDLDGTVLNAESRLEQETKEALQEIMKAGKKVTLCSSRSYEEMRTIIEELYEGCEDQFCIGFGGACVYRQDGSVVGIGGKIEKEVADFLIDDARARKIHVHGYGEKMLYYYEKTKEFQTFLSFAGVEHVPMKQLSYEEFKEKSFLKLMCLGEMEKLEDYNKEAGKVAYTAFSNPAGQQGYLDMCKAQVSKKTGVALLCRELNIDAKECICVGDGENDIPMPQFAGLGVAMKNAGEHVKKEADYTVPYTNCEGAIPYLVEKFMK